MINDENYILDLRDMPLFFEGLDTEEPEESYIPLSGTKRIDGLTPTPGDADSLE